MILGTVIKISSTIVVDGGDTVTSAKIGITGPEGAVVLSDTTAMSADTGTAGIWNYIYQSSTSGKVGNYTALIIAEAGSYTARARRQFTLKA